jgi:hypothetical protein
MSVTSSALTRIGNLASPHRIDVDDRGTVFIGDDRLEWWVGAEDRWHLAPVEPATRVRQWLVDDMPIVATALRVPGGEVVHRAYGARLPGGSDVLALEVENTSAVPVALALGMHGPRPVLLPRAPGQVVAADGGLRLTIVPVTHRTTTRAVVALDVTTVFPTGLPTAAQVASGWRAQTSRGLRLVLPDEHLQHDVDAARAQLLLASDDVARAVTLLHQGFVVEADEVLLAAAAVAERTTGRLTVDELVGLAELWRITRDPKLRDALVPLVTASARPLRKRRAPADATVGLRAVARLLDGPLADVGDAPRPTTLLDRVRAQLIDDGRDGCLDLLPLVPDEWLGQGVEVHEAPTAAGIVSYAVRWHGARPALLWDLDPHDGATVTITAPGLDPTWSTTDPRGEALLAPVEPPGGLPKVYGARPTGPRTTAPEVGESFL